MVLIKLKCQFILSLQFKIKFLLHNIFYVPNITENLVSASQFVKDNNCFIEFHPSYFLIKDKDPDQLLYQGSNKGILYTFSTTFESSSPSIHLGEHACLDTWHHRLGHPVSRTVHHVAFTFQLPLSHSNKIAIVCPTCQQGKCHQLPFFCFNLCLGLGLATLWN